MPNITSMFLLLAFICLMTGIFSPDIVIKWGIPHLKNRKNISYYLQWGNHRMFFFIRIK